MTRRPAGGRAGEAALGRLLRKVRMLRELRRRQGRFEGETFEETFRRRQRVRMPSVMPKVKDYDPEWPRLFQREKARLEAALGQWVADLQHFGSTAIPGMASQDVIDFYVVLKGKPAEPAVREALAALGYEHYGESPIDGQAVWFWRLEEDGRAFVAHVCEEGRGWLTRVVHFRDYMSYQPAERVRYARLKRELASQKKQDPLSYNIAKRALFVEFSEAAEAWVARQSRSFPAPVASLRPLRRVFRSPLVDSVLARPVYRGAGRTVRVGDVVKLLRDAGAKVFVAGGTTRDWLCGQEGKDVDLSVDQGCRDVHRLLREGFPGIDPVVLHNVRFGMLRWGDPALEELDINILRSPKDIRDGDVWTTRFRPRKSVEEDCRVRDFSINALYYAFEDSVLLDPLGCGRDDLDRRILRVVADPLVLDGDYRVSLRIVQFLCRGYTAAADTHEYLAHRFDRDVLGMAGRLPQWLTRQILAKGHSLEEFGREALRRARSGACREVLLRTLTDLRPPAAKAHGLPRGTAPS